MTEYLIGHTYFGATVVEADTGRELFVGADADAANYKRCCEACDELIAELDRRVADPDTPGRAERLRAMRPFLLRSIKRDPVRFAARLQELLPDA